MKIAMYNLEYWQGGILFGFRPTPASGTMGLMLFYLLHNMLCLLAADTM
jgi:hypothetical protein